MTPSRADKTRRNKAGGKPQAKPDRQRKGVRPDGRAERRKAGAPADKQTERRSRQPEPQWIAMREGERPAERVPTILQSISADGFHLIDSGHGLKLEQYGDYRIVRPEAQALWPPLLDEKIWANADAIFTGDTDEDGMGRWRFPKAALGETWPLRIMDIDFLGRFTAFRHVGVFPEQVAHWQWMRDVLETARGGKNPPKVLNLFGYTGVASLVAAAAGAEVTHVDASKKAIGWARENQALSGLNDRPIRWICDDAMKFIEREERRGNHYDIILTDPPKFGRGPNGEVWQLFEHLPRMLDLCRSILKPDALGFVLTAYSIRASFYSVHELMMETMRGFGGVVESGELVIREAGLSGDQPGRALSTSLYARWLPQ
ncbi:class I SAM-dependent methyltransferase [Martelella radicis]|uniref:23S rRNA (Cytosine1962-C5)-methyltransferase n=1 Tax=Martelella radicis TaxID=1397476 RepID=A0A7W6KQ51_9HYPH|nr:class I SAM-dependent methyltransferase [Martelella radicis]MBB4123908.1 23S rRNA (cytosine1962-C5)-methyltransferase [Martelella radicis]